MGARDPREEKEFTAFAQTAAKGLMREVLSWGLSRAFGQWK
jgi:hypothetical protein